MANEKGREIRENKVRECKVGMVKNVLIFTKRENDSISMESIRVTK